MNANELRKKFIEFFQGEDHIVIPSASLVPENDPSVLFTTAGMHPLVPYLMGESHPSGKRLVDVQKCIRTDDIDEVGDKVHHTFFEMLGNWSLGDYFKKEAIEWSYEFLMKELGVKPENFAVSVFAGDDDAPFDKEAYDIWISLGISADRIAKLPKKNNWWGPAGETGPCGPDTEMFIWTGSEPAPSNFQETNEDPAWVEVWNDVFMQYNKTGEGKFEPLAQKNVDTGMGMERMLAVVNGLDDNYKTDLFLPIIEKIEEISGKKYQESEKEFRIIADHIKAATFAIGDGAFPSNKGSGYISRRLVRRGVVYLYLLVGNKYDSELTKLYSVIKDIYAHTYTNTFSDETLKKLQDEEAKSISLIVGGIDKIGFGLMGNEKAGYRHTGGEMDPDKFFDLYQSHGLYPEITLELMKRVGFPLTPEDEKYYLSEFNKRFKKHQELSRTASAGMFKGGLADAGDVAVKYHTTTHLLHQALRQVLGEHVQQKGSNITAERLRFDFVHPDKMTPEQIQEVENIVNDQIAKDLSVTLEEMSVDEAKKSGALGFFEHKYGEKVKVYTIGPSTPSGRSGSREFFSREICGGPHVTHTGELGHFKIKKEESSSSGVRRIKAVLE